MTHGFVSSIPARVTIKAPLVRKATGNHLVKSTSLEKTRSPVSGFCYGRNRVCNTVLLRIADGRSQREKSEGILNLLTSRETNFTLGFSMPWVLRRWRCFSRPYNSSQLLVFRLALERDSKHNPSTSKNMRKSALEWNESLRACKLAAMQRLTLPTLDAWWITGSNPERFTTKTLPVGENNVTSPHRTQNVSSSRVSHAVDIYFLG